MAESVAGKVVEDVNEPSVFGLDAHTLLSGEPDALSEVTHCLQPCSRFVANQNINLCQPASYNSLDTVEFPPSPTFCITPAKVPLIRVIFNSITCTHGDT